MKKYFGELVEKFKGLSLQKKIFLGVISTLCLGFVLFSTANTFGNVNGLTRLEKIPKKRVNPTPKTYQSDISSVKQVSPNELLAYREQALDMGYARNYGGYISIPEIGMYLPIMNGVNMYTLSLGAASYYPNERKMGGFGNYVLAGHNMDTSRNVLFSRLPNVSIGKQSKIILTDGTKNYYYHVVSKKIVNPNQKVIRGTLTPTKDSVLYNDKSKRVLTLFTCNYTGSKRIVVKGTYDHETQNKRGERS